MSWPEIYTIKNQYEIQVKFGEKKIADFSCPKKNLIFVSCEKNLGLAVKKKHTAFSLLKKAVKWYVPKGEKMIASD